MHDQRAAVQRPVDQLRAGVKAQSLGKFVDLVAVEVPGAGVLTRVEVAGESADFRADVDGRQVANLIGTGWQVANLVGTGRGALTGLGGTGRGVLAGLVGAGRGTLANLGGGRRRAGAKEDHGERHQAGGLRVNAGGGDADGCEGSLLLGGEVVQRGL